MLPTMAETVEGPLKRKRPSGDEGDEDPLKAILNTAQHTQTKKARLQNFDDAASDLATSSPPSLVDSHTATATLPASNTPITEGSSARSKNKPRPKKYLCTFPNCSKAYNRPIHLQTHLNSHTGERPHQCTEDGCDKSFLKPEHLTRHMKEKHGDQRFECTFECYNDTTGMLGPCGKVFESSNKLKRHQAMHEGKEETTCSWEGCGKVFRKQETLQRHIKKDHLNEDSYMCTKDGCGKCFPTPGLLKSHHAREHQAPKYVCEICTHAMMPQVEDAIPVWNDLDPDFLPSPEDVQGLADDVDAQMIGSLSLQDNTTSTLQLPGAIIGFATYHELQRHNKFMHPPICTQCGKKCKSPKDLSAHMDIEHPPAGVPAAPFPQPEKRFVCPYQGCDRAVLENGFTKKGNVDQHIKSVHTKEKNFVCGQFHVGNNKKIEGWNGRGCGLALGTKQSLIGHIRTQHLGLSALASASTVSKTKRQQRTTRPKQEMPGVGEDEMDMDAVPEVGGPSASLAMLTGVGYEQQRPHACFLAEASHGCQMRFVNFYELGMHMELTHGWNVDDINDRMVDQAPAMPPDV